MNSDVQVVPHNKVLQMAIKVKNRTIATSSCHTKILSQPLVTENRRAIYIFYFQDMIHEHRD